MITSPQQAPRRNKIIVPLLLQFIAGGAYAQSPAATQQAVESVPSAAQTQKPSTPKPKPNASKKEKAAYLKAWLESPAVKQALTRFLKHPYLTNTANSVYTPAGVPMKWGGIGIAGDVFNRYPTQKTDTWSGGATVAIPFGDSDKWVGGAVSINNANLGKNSSFGQEGTIGLIFSRWFAKSTLATAGVANLVPWGPGFSNASKTYYGAVTQLFGPIINHETHTVSASIGIGSGAFAPLGELNAAGNLVALNDSRIYPFANAAFNVTRNLALVGDYYSETGAVGVSYNKQIILPFSFLLYAGNLRHTRTAPSTTFGLRIATGFALPGKLG